MLLKQLPAIKIPLIFFLIISFFIALTIGLLFQINHQQNQYLTLNQEKNKYVQQLDLFQKQDQVLVNKQLNNQIQAIHDTFQKASISYQNLIDLSINVKDTKKQDLLFAQILALLSDKNYASASALLTSLDNQIKDENNKIAVQAIPTQVPQNNQPPNSGYRRQSVLVNNVSFMVDIVTADLNNTKVIIDTASDSTCTNNCSVKPLAEYVSRSGAFAGVNGTYFCPDTYPECANKTNSFDLLVMNKNKVYFNSDNNVYSTNPAAIFSGNSARFIRQTLEWGRDTSVDAVISNYPLLLLNNQIAFSSQGDAKMNIKTVRGFVGASGNTVYIGIVHGATVDETAKVLSALGIANALNLDDGGSAALWSGGYKVGPGRNIPNAVLLVKK